MINITQEQVIQNLMSEDLRVSIDRNDFFISMFFVKVFLSYMFEMLFRVKTYIQTDGLFYTGMLRR